MSSPIVVFDLDGTLVDTAPDLLASLNHVLNAEGLPTTDIEALRKYVGQGGRVMLQRAFNAAGREFDDEIADRLVADFVVHYGNNMPGASLPFDGVLNAMDALESEGFVFAVCTNKTERLAVKLLDALGLSDRFRAVCGGDTFTFKKPDGRHILETVQAASGDPTRAVMIGDSYAEIGAAHDAKVPVIAVDFGYTDEHVSTFKPTKVISHYDEMTVELVKELIT
ncbi:MAG: HAD family hydrolase [Pseudomonadota bacterium]